MLLLVHVCIALSSIGFTTYLFVSPTKTKFYIDYALIGLTLISGTALVIASHSPILAACETGLLYIGVVLSGLVAAHYRLVRETSRRSDDTQ